MTPLTRPARWVLLGAAALFLLAAGLRLNGSSSPFWHAANLDDIRVRDNASGLLLGTPKHIRGDEWFVWTPALLSQARQPQPFPVTNPSLGPGATPLLMGLPARHYTMMFRPQLWGYFVLPFAWAFAWAWNAKVFGLFAALFYLFWTVTGGRLGWSLFGALAIQYSGFVQWWFSTPAALPEMLACWAVGCVAAIALFAPGRAWRWQLVSAAALTWSTADFLLCCYPAFAVPLLHLGACVVGGHVWQRRWWSWRGAGWLAGALALTGLLLVPWTLDCLPALRIEAHTVYPGQRHAYGGDLSGTGYLAGLFTLGMGEFDYPAVLGNICEGSNFYPLWLLPLGLGAWAFARRLRRGDGTVGTWLRERGLLVALAGFALVYTLYILVPLPHWFCEATLLSRTKERRALLGLGVAGTMLLTLALAARPAGIVRPARREVIAGLAWTVGVLAFLLGERSAMAPYMTPWRVAAFAGTAAFAAGAFLCGPRWLLPVAWVGAFFLKLALVNPLCIGLPEYLASPGMNRLRAVVQADPTAGWAVYNSLAGAELIKTSGAWVVNGARVIPDWGLIDRLDPRHQHLDAYNQYSHLYFRDAPYSVDVPVSLVSMFYCNIGLHPRRLRELFPEVKYMASSRPMPDVAEAGFEPLLSVPENHLWVYRVAR